MATTTGSMGEESGLQKRIQRQNEKECMERSRRELQQEMGKRRERRQGNTWISDSLNALSTVRRSGP